MGWLSPVGVSSPTGDAILYSAWQEFFRLDPMRPLSEQGLGPGDAVGTPSLRLLNLSSGEDSLFEPGAYSAAWRRDGAIAYFLGASRDFRLATPYLGHVFVRDGLEGSPERWTSGQGRYIVIAWARHVLLVYRMLEGEHLDLLALDGPGESRVLAEGAALVALSPDGKRAIVDQGGVAKILEVADGTQAVSLNLHSTRDPNGGRPLRRLEHSGSWVNGRIVAETDVGLAVLEAGRRTLRVERIVHLPKRTYRFGIAEPQFANDEGTRVIAWASIPGSGGLARGLLYVYLDCDIARQRCVQGPPRGERSFFRVYNPSRPMEAEH